jgi:hypothetical protein
MKPELYKLAFKTALFHFFMVSIFGLVLRYSQAFGVSFINYKFLLHAHSHYAMGGWMFTCLFAGILSVFKLVNDGNEKRYLSIFWLAQIGIAGMVFTFPLQGYGFWSIMFSEVYVIATYWLTYQLWKDIRSDIASSKFLKSALLFLVLSSLGPYAVGPMMANQMANSVWYYDAVYFYLHFQCNGWMVFALTAMALKHLESKNLIMNNKQAHVGWLLMNVGCVLTYFLSVLWSKPGLLFNIVGGAGALIQLVGIYYLLKCILPFRGFLYNNHRTVQTLSIMALLAFTLKILLQAISALPILAEVAYRYPNFIIAYLHLVFIGFMSAGLIAFFTAKGLLALNRVTLAGVIIFFSGFVVTELLLVAQSILAWQGMPAIAGFSQYMFYCSLTMPTGLFFVLVSQCPLRNFICILSPKKNLYEAA